MKSFIVLAVLVAVAAAQSQKYQDDVILKQESDVAPDGYVYGYETSNGITAQERGNLKNVGSDAEGIDVQGSYAYKGDDGTVYSVNYVANEGGFQAEGAHIPTPAPVPEYILRALEYIRTHPPKVEYKN